MAAIQDIQEAIVNAIHALWQFPSVRGFAVVFLLGPPVVLLVGWGVHRVLHAITTSRPTRAQRLTVHIALLCIGVGFILPLVWMISTSLKPLDQTQELTPSFIPVQWFTRIEDKTVPVKLQLTLTEQHAVVREGDAGLPRLVPEAEISQFTVIRRIDASEKQPWAKVRIDSPDAAAAGKWYVVPMADMEQRISPQWGNYADVISHEQMHFPLFARNTLIIAVLCVVGMTLSSAFVAYGFAKINFRGRGVLFAIMLATMMIPFPVTMVSMFAIFRWMGENGLGQWLGTFRPLWVPAWFGSAFNIFLLRQFFRTLPDELSEAARIDGCSELGIFLRIVLPLSRPALAVVALFTFMAVWNDFLAPLVYLQDQQQYTLALGLQTFQSQHGGTEWHYLMAASVLILAPVIVLFFIAQETFIQGIATTGIK